MRQLIAIFGIFLATSVFPAVPLPLSVQWYAQAGLEQHQSIEQAMLAKRHPMQMYAAPTTKLGSAQKAWPKVSNETVNSCQDYLHYIHRRYVPATPQDQRLSDGYERVCGTLSYLLHAGIARENFILSSGLSLGLSELWRSLPASMLLQQEASPQPKGTIVEHCPDTKVVALLPAEPLRAGVASRYLVTLHSKQCASYIQIQLLAQGDIDHDGTQDVLVDLYAWGDNGDYRGQKVLVLSQASAQSPVKPMPWQAAFVVQDDGD